MVSLEYAAPQPAGGPGADEGRLRLGIRQRAQLYEVSRAFSELIDLDELLPTVIAKTGRVAGIALAFFLHNLGWQFLSHDVGEPGVRSVRVRLRGGVVGAGGRDRGHGA
jgi:hypothetical protein